MKNAQTAEKFHLGKLIEEIKKGRFVIPDFQRDPEWQPWDVEALLRSIFMDYYVGTLLLWAGKKSNYEALSCKPLFGFKGKGDPGYIVLDGQQRLTALHYAFFQPDKEFPNRKKPFVFFLNVRSLLAGDWEDAVVYSSLTKHYRYVLDSQREQHEGHLFPLGIMKGGTWDIDEWIKAYRDYWQAKLDSPEAKKDENKKMVASAKTAVVDALRFRELINDLLNNYHISYIELKDDIEVGKVCDIFTNINNTGVSLDIFDLLNAILRPKGVKLKDMWSREADRLSFTDTKKMKVYVLQVMSILEQAYCSSKYLYYLVPGNTRTIKHPDGTLHEVVQVADAASFIAKWKDAVDAIEHAIEVLRNPRDLGAITPAYVPYASIIPVLSALLKHAERYQGKNAAAVQDKIRYWYWAAVFSNRYSSTVESKAAKDFMDVSKWLDNDRARPEVVEEFGQFYESIDFRAEETNSGAIYRAIFNLFIIKGAKDWATFKLPEYSKLDDHHILPQSIGRKLGYRHINSILNRAPLADKTNRHVISNEHPNVYVKRMLKENDPKKVYDTFASHLISKKAVDILLRDPFTEKDFNEFLSARAETILEAIEETCVEEVFVEMNRKNPPPDDL